MADWLNRKELDQARAGIKQDAKAAKEAIKHRYFAWQQYYASYDKAFRSILMDTGKYIVEKGSYTVREGEFIDSAMGVRWGEWGNGSRIKMSYGLSEYVNSDVTAGSHWWEYFDKYDYVHQWFLSSSNLMPMKKSKPYAAVFVEIALRHAVSEHIEPNSPYPGPTRYPSENIIELAPDIEQRRFWMEAHSDVNADLDALKQQIKNAITAGALRKVTLKRGLFSSKWVEKDALGYEIEIMSGERYFM